MTVPYPCLLETLGLGALDVLSGSSRLHLSGVQIVNFRMMSGQRAEGYGQGKEKGGRLWLVAVSI